VGKFVKDVRNQINAVRDEQFGVADFFVGIKFEAYLGDDARCPQPAQEKPREVGQRRPLGNPVGADGRRADPADLTR